MADKKDSEEGGEESAPKKKLPIAAILIGLQCLGLIAAAGLVAKSAFFTAGPDLGETRLAERAIASIQDDLKKIQILDLKEFRVNLPQNHILKASIQLEVSDEATVAALNGRMLAIKARVLEVLASQSLEKTTSFQGKLALKEALRDAINHELNLGRTPATSGVVREVFFVDLVLI